LRSTGCVAVEARQELPTSGGDYSIGGEEVSAIKMVAVVLIVAGVLGLVYGGFSYTKETHEATVGPIQLTLKDKKTVNIPVWAGAGAIVIGGMLLLFGGRKN
jgi:hypothetical protein